MTKSDALKMMVNYLGAESEHALKVIGDIRACHARFEFLDNMYAHHLAMTM